MLKRAYRVGGAAVRLLLNNDSDRMVTLVRETGPQYRCTTDSVEIARVADQQRPLPREFLDANRMMITGAFYDYAIPLLGDPLPTYPQLEMIKVNGHHVEHTPGSA